MVYLVKGKSKGRLWCGHRGRDYVVVERKNGVFTLCLRCAYEEKVIVDRSVSEEEWNRLNFGDKLKVW